MGNLTKAAVSWRMVYRDMALAEGFTAYWIAIAFVVYATFAIAFLSINMPPFQNPDEHAHFLRAAQLADGVPIGTRFSYTRTDGQPDISAGGLADPAIQQAARPFNALLFHPERRVTLEDWAPRVHWSSERINVGFPNTVINPPFFYVPSAIGVLVGRLTRMTVVQTLIVSRALTGLAAIAVGTTAIVVAGGAAPWIFAVLTLPMSLSLIASSSQDALLLTCCALAGSLMVRVLRCPDKPRARTLSAIVIALSLTAMARPPCAALALLPIALVNVPWRSRLLATGVIATCVLVWSAIDAVTSMTNLGDLVGANPRAQLTLLRHDPLLAVRVAWQTVSQQWLSWLDGFVGRLGWFDTILPTSYRNAALSQLGVAAVAASLRPPGARVSAGSRVIIATALLLSAAGVFAAMYLTWTPPGNATVEGVQGRYFLPLAVAGAALLPSLGGTRWPWLRNSIVAAVMAFPFVSLAVVMRAIVLRYYLG